MNSIVKKILIVVGLTAAAATPLAAQADRFSIGIGVGGPGYYAPAYGPGYYAPPVVYGPAPAYYGPAYYGPGYYGPRVGFGYYGGYHGGWGGYRGGYGHGFHGGGYGHHR